MKPVRLNLAFILLTLVSVMSSSDVFGQGNVRKTVDLGLPSGLQWAICNIGANRPEEEGLYFQWGDTEGHKKGDDYEYTGDTYRKLPSRSVKGNLPFNYDTARHFLGKDWRMPTATDYKELFTNCDKFWDVNYKNTGVKGLRLVSKKNGNEILFPCVGSYFEGCYYHDDKESAIYWTASIYNKDDDLAHGFFFYFMNNRIDTSINFNDRFCGNVIRAVHDK